MLSIIPLIESLMAEGKTIASLMYPVNGWLPPWKAPNWSVLSVNVQPEFVFCDVPAAPLVYIVAKLELLINFPVWMVNLFNKALRPCA